MLERYKWNIWYCRRLEPWESEYVEGMEKFAPPVPRRLNVYPVSSELLLESGGDLNSQYLKGKLPTEYPELYAEGASLTSLLPKNTTQKIQGVTMRLKV